MDEQKERAAFEASCQSIGFTTRCNVEGDYLLGYGAELWSGWKARAALAAAPAPAPLTDEQIEALRCIDDCGEAAPEFSRIVRIAERAHGIGTDAAPAPAMPGNWHVFNSGGANVATVLTYDEAMGYLTPERLARGWSAVCVVDKDSIGTNEARAQAQKGS